MIKEPKNPLDKSNLRQIILDTPKQFAAGLEVAENIDLKGKFDSLVVCGMGGSALPGYLFKNAFQTKFPTFTHSSYDLPLQTTENPLFFISSFSGNTEEPLSSYQKAKEKNLPLVAFSNGGQLKKQAEKDQLPNVFYDIDYPGFQPRYALPAAFSAMAQVAQKAGLIKDAISPIQATANFLEKLEQTKIEQAAQKIVEKIKGRIPLFYADYELRFAARINKIKVNENAKLPAFWNFYPELNHNEFNSYLNGNPKNFIILSFKNPAAHPRNQKRLQITNEILRELNYEIIDLEIEGGNTLQRIFYALNYGDWISYYLALSVGQDPSPVAMIEKLKRKL